MRFRVRSLVSNAAVAAYCCLSVFTSPMQAAEEHGSEQLALSFAQKAEYVADGIIRTTMKDYNIPGLTLSIVKDGKLIVLKGYGYANLENKIPVDPYKTMFRIGSTSKTFTWTAIMQLVEQGKIDLSENVNVYLKDFQLPEPHGKPLTLNDIMAHRPGYEDGAAGFLFANDPDKVVSVSELLKNHIPAQVRAPGVAVSYSNFATAIAGLIVQDVSGQPYNDYIEKHILKPLGMNYTTFREPLGQNHSEVSVSEELIPFFASGYEEKAERLDDIGFIYIHSVGPAGSGSSSAADMAKYMIAHLQKGTYEGAQILKPETVDLMRTRNFTDHPESHEFAHGFFNGKTDGYEFFDHGGGTVAFRTMLRFFPELDFGVFVSSSQGNGTAQVYDIPNLLVSALFEPKEILEDISPDKALLQTGQKFTGTYLSNRRSFTTLEGLGGLFSSAVNIAISAEGYLVRTAASGATSWIQTGPLTFRSVKSSAVMTFDAAEDGSILRYHNESGHVSADKTSFFGTPRFMFMAVGLAALFATTTIVGSIYRRKLETGTDLPVYGKVAFATGSLVIVWLFTAGYALAALASAGSTILWDFPTSGLSFLVVMSLVTSTAILALVATIKPVWQSSGWHIVRKIHHSMFAVSGLLFVYALWVWNLLGFNY